MSRPKSKNVAVRADLAPNLANWQEAYRAAFPAEWTENALRKADEDPEYRAQMVAARNILVDMLRFEAVRKCLPYYRPIYQRGYKVGEEEVREYKHIEWMLERLDPDEFHLATKIEHSGGDRPISFAWEMGPTELDGDAEDADYDELEAG